MRFPHRVRISDPRNRQPASGKSYVATNYDFIRQYGTLDVVGMPNYETVIVEPKDASSPIYDVSALVSMTDDGDRDKETISFSIRIPISQFNKCREFFIKERARSLNDFGYVRQRADPIRFYNLGNEITLETVNELSLSSARLENVVNARYLSVQPVPGFPNPFLNRAIKGTFAYDVTVDSNTGIPTFRGLFPPIKSIVSSGGIVLETAGRSPNIRVNLGDGYEIYFEVRRIDTFLDVVELRCFEALPYL